jgi:hypothetical protein
MDKASQFTRRDPRLELPAGTASVEFVIEGQDSQSVRAEVISISSSGCGFSLADDTPIEVGTILSMASVCINETIVQGDLKVCYVKPRAGSGIECGCLFYPVSLTDSAGWALLLKRGSSNGSTPAPQLVLRCANCHSTVWIGDTDQADHLCPVCNQTYGFGKPIRGHQLEELHQQARGLAGELTIDFPSAVSMLLGMLTLEEVKDVLGETPMAEQAAPEGRSSSFDRAFMPAVAAGTLTEAQAVQRGSREAYANQLVARHRIRLGDAYDVTDNRKSLSVLLRARKAGAQITATYERPATKSRIPLLAALAVIALLIGVGVVRKLDDSLNSPTTQTNPQRVGHAPSAPPSLMDPDVSELPVESYARVKRNTRGEVAHVEATDPRNVLLAFCKSHAPELRLEPVDVVPTEPPSDVARMGVLRDLDKNEDYRVIVIRKDLKTRRWYVGNPGDPDAQVSTFPSPEWLAGATENASIARTAP